MPRDAGVTSPHLLAVQGLTKVFASQDGPVRAVDDVSFEIRGDEFFTMLGPSGCGKTTTLRMIAGLESPTTGSIRFDGQDFTRLAPAARNIGMVFQSYALFPHLSVFDNVAFGLRIRATSRAEMQARVTRILGVLGLDRLAARFPTDLSGGQQQRVSIARALVYEPGMLLLDEPLANLDAKLRVEMREEIRRVQKELGIMTLYVTHDQEEAMAISDRVAVFSHGRLIQVGPPEHVYAAPSSLFAADFVGKANFLPVTKLEGEAATLADGTVVQAARRHAVAAAEIDRLPAGAAGLLMLRPESLALHPAGQAPHGCRVLRRQFLGSIIRYVVESPLSPAEIMIDMHRPVPGVAENGVASFLLRPEEASLFAR